MPCSEISAEWASQRIKNLDLKAAIKSALLGSRSKDGEVITTLIDRFHYPRLGPGMMWERCRDRLAERGVPTLTETRVVRIRHQARPRRSAVDGAGRRDARARDRGRPRHRLDAALGADARARSGAAGRGARRGAAAALPRLPHRRPDRRARGRLPRHLDLRSRARGQARPHPELQELEPRDGARAGAHQPRPRVLRAARATSCGAWTIAR